MKAVKISAIVLLIAVLIVHVRGGSHVPIVRMLPWMGGHKPSLHDIGLLALVFLAFWGVRRLRDRE